MSANQAQHPIATQCRLMDVSPSGYYAWAKRPPSARSLADDELMARIRKSHESSKGTYGAPRIHAELAAEGFHVGRKRVARLMKAAEITGVSRRKFVTTTIRDGGRQAPDLVDRQFTVQRPNRLWVADITYVPSWAGFVYLAVVLDAFSRRIVGWPPSAQARLRRWGGDPAHASRAGRARYGADDAAAERRDSSFRSRNVVLEARVFDTTYFH